jgi:RHS repeat-associated protein
VGLYHVQRLGPWNGVGLKPTRTTALQRRRGDKFFEITNHLGNVITTVSDHMLGEGTTALTYYQAQVKTYADYYPFGMEMQNRTSSSPHYRYGFNGKEKDQAGEFSAGQTHYDYGFRIYNPVWGRFLSVDPLYPSYPWNSTYAFAQNDVVRSIDLDGGEKKIVTHYANVTKNGSLVYGGTSVDIDFNAVSASGNAMTITRVAVVKEDGDVVPITDIGSFEEPIKNCGTCLSPSAAWNYLDDEDDSAKMEDDFNYILNGGSYGKVFERDVKAPENLPNVVAAGTAAGFYFGRFTRAFLRKPLQGQTRSTPGPVKVPVDLKKKGTLKFASRVNKDKQVSHGHLKSADGNNAKSYMYSQEDAQKVLDAYNSGKYRLVEESVQNNRVLIVVDDVKGVFVSTPKPGTTQIRIEKETNVFEIHSTKQPKIVPVNPNKGE